MKANDIRKERALRKYYDNPNHCKKCGSVIIINDGQTPSEVRKKTFCNVKCSNSYRKRSKRTSKEIKCNRCQSKIVVHKNKSGEFRRRRFCDSCLGDVRANSKGAIYIAHLTKRDLFDKYGKYYLVRNAIRKHAVAVFNKSTNSLV